MLHDGGFTTPQGNLLQTNYVRSVRRVAVGPASLLANWASEPQFDLRTTGAIRLSRPGVFRTTGLVRYICPGGDQEGEARMTVTQGNRRGTRRSSRIWGKAHTCAFCRPCYSATGRCRSKRQPKRSGGTPPPAVMEYYVRHLGLADLKLHVHLDPTPRRGGHLAPPKSFPNSYTSVEARIYRAHAVQPRHWVWRSASMSAQPGSPAPISGTFYGFRTAKVERIPQLGAKHGPVLYVDAHLSVHCRSGEGLGADMFHDLREVAGVRGAKGIPVCRDVDPCGTGRPSRPAGLRE